MTGPAFDGQPFVAGSLVGLRTFMVAPGNHPELRGLSFPVVFAPGENEAHCALLEAGYFRDGLADFGLGFTFDACMNLATYQAEARKMLHRVDVLRAAIKREPCPVRPEHKVAGLGCGCGYYAYTDLQDTRQGVGRLLDAGFWAEGIIEGYGTCTVGSRGFRASKARLVALVRHPLLAVKYGVPSYPSTAEALAAHPLTSVAA